MGLFSSITDTLFGGSKQTSKTNPDQVWGEQVPFFKNLYGNAQDLMNQQRNVGQYAGGIAGGIMGGMGPWSMAGSNPAIQNLMQRASGSNPYLDQQIAGYGADLGNFFKNNVLSSIQSQAGLAGQFGGSRQGVAAGMAGQDLARQFAQGATQMRSDAYNSGTQAAGIAGGLAGQSLGNIGNLYNLGMSPYSAAWSPLMNMSNIMGGPVVLGQGGSSSGHTSNGIFGQIGGTFGPFTVGG